jgi:hypothetical protein
MTKTNKSIALVLTILLVITSCHNRLGKNILPSNDLINSVISGAIKTYPLNVFKYSKSQVDSLIKFDMWSPNYALNSALSEWIITQGSIKDSSIENISHVFDLDYINQRLYRKNNLRIFNSQDSIFIYSQIEEPYLDTLRFESYPNIRYTNYKEIKSLSSINDPDTIQKFLYCQFSKPLFNITKTFAILGLSIYDISTDHEGGIYLIMSKKSNDWIITTDLDWWGH